jgi:hypothetical protein
MFGVLEFFIFPDFVISIFETLNNPGYQLLIFKKFQKLRIQLFKNTNFKYLIISEHLIFDCKRRFKNFKVIWSEISKF